MVVLKVDVRELKDAEALSDFLKAMSYVENVEIEDPLSDLDQQVDEKALEQQNYFKDYMLNMGLKPSTAHIYISALTRLSKHYSEISENKSIIFHINESEEIQSICDFYERERSFFDFWSKRNFVAKAAMSKYSQFLEFQHSTVEIKDWTPEVMLRIQGKNKQFSSLYIESYKKLRRLKFENLNRINVFAGENNTGKSSLLEAVLLLCSQNDFNRFQEIIKRRAKYISDIKSDLMDANLALNKGVSISGVFDGIETSVKINREIEEDSQFNKFNYLSTIYFESFFSTEQLNSKTRLFKNRQPEQYYNSVKYLCNSFLSSPFSMISNSELSLGWNKTIEAKSKENIIHFLRTVDGSIEDIDLNLAMRFLVNHTDFAKSIDITEFGEGLQRIFQIALLFAASKNGVLLIDEFENAIHYSLLKKFASFVFELSEIFNVQVFITSHSRECINAFFDESLDLTKVSGYHLFSEDGEVRVAQENGKTFGRLIKSFNADLR